MPSQKELIQNAAIALLEGAPEGIRWMALQRGVRAALPESQHNTIKGNLVRLVDDYPDTVYKPARGLFKATAFRGSETPAEQIRQEDPGEAADRLTEQHFYESFAEWLVNDLEECTKAIPVGGNLLARDRKWATPDVIGIWQSRRNDPYQPAIEIVSAEIKINTAAWTSAFGQACAYKLFSHRSYIVVPRGSPPEDLARLDALCGTLGIGLVFFNAADPVTPEYEVRVRAAKHDPDAFYANESLKRTAEKLFD